MFDTRIPRLVFSIYPQIESFKEKPPSYKSQSDIKKHRWVRHGSLPGLVREIEVDVAFGRFVGHPRDLPAWLPETRCSAWLKLEELRHRI